MIIFLKKVTARTLVGLRDPGIMSSFQKQHLIVMKMPKASGISNYVLNMPKRLQTAELAFLGLNTVQG